MGIIFHHRFFDSPAEVMDDVKKNGTWPTTFVSGPSEGLHTHWHADEVHAYIVEGETDFLDAESEVRTQVGPGDKIVIPARTLHAEGAVAQRVCLHPGTPQAAASGRFLEHARSGRARESRLKPGVLKSARNLGSE